MKKKPHPFVVLIFTLVWLTPGTLLSQRKNADAFSVHVKKTSEKITLDGNLSENNWQQAEVVDGFFQNYPSDTSSALAKTEVRMVYNDQFLYIGVVCYQESEKYITPSLKRDYSSSLSDAFTVYLDPFNDKVNGFYFGINPYGVQREGLLVNGGTYGTNGDWDNKWYSEVKRMPGKWIAELAIPFKSLRYKPNSSEWHVNFSRNELTLNERSAWVPVPKNFSISSLNYTASLYWEEPLKKAGANVALIPYLTGRQDADYQSGIVKNGYNGGIDAKVAVSSSINLDITVNPDFSQVEVDRQITNLSRFSLFFPEKRSFFIENSDLFSNYGFSKIKPFFSRRIGLYNNVQVPILAGARISGKLDKNWRIGAMSMQTEGLHTPGLPSQNFSMLSVQRNIFTRSVLSGFFINRQGLRGEKINYADYNRIAGLEYYLGSADNKWNGKMFYHRNFDTGHGQQKDATALWLTWNTPRLYLEWNHEYVGAGYNADVGYVPRTGYGRIEPRATWMIYPESRLINTHQIELYSSVYWDNQYWRYDDAEYELSYSATFLNTASAEISVTEMFTRLTLPFDASGSGGLPLPEGSYFYREAGAYFNSDFRKTLNYYGGITYGSYFNGNKLSYYGGGSVRAQPWGIFSMNVEQNDIRLPLPYNTARLTLVGPKIELSFTKSLFFTTFIQYNTQVDNVNINARLQWRFKPMSDLYIVYTDNYYSERIAIKNRAFVVKLNYWFTT